MEQMMVTEDNNRVIHVRSSEMRCCREKEDNHDEQHPQNSRQSNRTALLMNKK